MNFRNESTEKNNNLKQKLLGPKLNRIQEDTAFEIRISRR